jgi:hypothetical protein
VLATSRERPWSRRERETHSRAGLEVTRAGTKSQATIPMLLLSTAMPVWARLHARLDPSSSHFLIALGQMPNAKCPQLQGPRSDELLATSSAQQLPHEGSQRWKKPWHQACALTLHGREMNGRSSMMKLADEQPTAPPSGFLPWVDEDPTLVGAASGRIAQTHAGPRH